MSQDDEFYEMAIDRYGDRIERLSPDELAELEEMYHEKLDEFGNERLALTAAVGNFNFERHGSSQGGEYEVYKLGAQGPRPFGQDDQGNDEFAVIGRVLVVPSDEPAGIASVIVQGSDVSRSLESVVGWFSDEMFGPGKIRGSLSSVDEVPGGYTLNMTDDSEPFGELDEDERTLSDQQVRQQFEQRVEMADIASVGSHLSITNSDGFTAGFGCDLKRIEYATVLASAVTENSNRFVIMDESYLEPSELPRAVRGEDEEPGLVCWSNPRICRFEEESIVNVWGTLSKNGDGQVEMRVVGWEAPDGNDELVSLQPSPFDESGSSSRRSSSESESDESNVGESMNERTI